MIQPLHARCRACEYEATVGVGKDEGATVPVVWAPALCPACSVVSVNVAGASDRRCHECGEGVTLYSETGALPGAPEGWPCPECREPALAFSPAAP